MNTTLKHCSSLLFGIVVGLLSGYCLNLIFVSSVSPMIPVISDKELFGGQVELPRQTNTYSSSTLQQNASSSSSSTKENLRATTDAFAEMFSTENTKCVTKFIEYHPSIYEHEWAIDATMDIVKKKGLCKLMRSQKFGKWSSTYMNDDEKHRFVLHYAPTNQPTCSRSLTKDLDPDVYSSFEYERVCPETAEGYDDKVNGIVTSEKIEEVQVSSSQYQRLLSRKLSAESNGDGDSVAKGCGIVCGGTGAGIAYESFDNILNETSNKMGVGSAGLSGTGGIAGTIKVKRTRFTTFIEPLVGLLREPRLCLMSKLKSQKARKLHLKQTLLVKCWLAIDPLATFTNNSFPGKRFFFDLGASSWASGAGGASQSWFYHTYRTYCAEFNEIYAWEMTQIDASQFFKDIPDHLKPGYHYFNHAMTTEWGSWDNPLMHMLQRTSPDDFVVLKIDIDSGSVEGALIDQIIANEQIAERIDELFFEHHVKMEVMDPIWKTNMDPRRTYVDSLRLFSNLRKRGIRAHSWV